MVSFRPANGWSRESLYHSHGFGDALLRASSKAIAGPTARSRLVEVDPVLRESNSYEFEAYAHHRRSKKRRRTPAAGFDVREGVMFLEVT